MRRLLAVWLVGMLAATVLVACGGGGDDDAADGVEAAADADAGADEADAPDQEDAPDEEDAGDDADGGVAALGVFTAAKCTEAIQVYSTAAVSASQAMSGETKAMKAAIAQMKEFADNAPRDVRDDLRLMSDAYATYATGIADSGWNPTTGKAPTDEQVKKLEAAGAVFQDEDYVTAQEHIDSWFTSDCGNR